MLESMVEGVLFLSFFSLLPVAWFYMLQIAGVKLFRISIPAILMLSIFIFQYIGFPILFFELDEYRAQFTNDQNVLWQAFAWSSVTITLLVSGFMVGRKLFGPLHTMQYFNAFGHIPSPAVFIERLIIFLILAAGILVLVQYVQIIGLSNLALLAVINTVDSETNSNVLRSAMGNDFSGNYHWYSLFMRDFLQIATMALFATFLLSRRKLHLIIFLVGLSVSLFSTLMATEKAPVFWLIISLIMVYLVVSKAGYLPGKLITFSVPVFILLLGYIYVYFMGSPNVLAGIESGLSRTFTGQMVGVYHYLIIFPDQVDYLLGRSFPNPGGLLPWEPYRLTVEVMNIVHPSSVALDVVGTMPTFFWGEMYANFGSFGILIPPFFVGLCLYLVNILIFRLPMTPLVLSIFIWFILHFKNLAGTGLSGFIINIFGAIIVIVLLVALFAMGRGVIRFKRTRAFSNS